MQAHSDPVPKNFIITLKSLTAFIDDALALIRVDMNSFISRRFNLSFVALLPIIQAYNQLETQVHDLAWQENMPEGLKMHDRTNHVLFESAWIAGVDCV